MSVLVATGGSVAVGVSIVGADAVAVMLGGFTVGVACVTGVQPTVRVNDTKRARLKRAIFLYNAISLGDVTNLLYQAIRLVKINSHNLKTR